MGKGAHWKSPPGGLSHPIKTLVVKTLQYISAEIRKTRILDFGANVVNS